MICFTLHKKNKDLRISNCLVQETLDLSCSWRCKWRFKLLTNFYSLPWNSPFYRFISLNVVVFKAVSPVCNTRRIVVEICIRSIVYLRCLRIYRVYQTTEIYFIINDLRCVRKNARVIPLLFLVALFSQQKICREAVSSNQVSYFKCTLYIFLWDLLKILDILKYTMSSNSTTVWVY